MADAPPGSVRFLSIIELQNAIAEAALNSEEVMRVVADRALQILGGASAGVELVEVEDWAGRPAPGPTQQLGVRRSLKSVLTGKCIEGRKPVRSDDGRTVCVPL